MRRTHSYASFIAILAAGAGLVFGAANAAEKIAHNELNPGFNPATGQINLGVATQVPSGSPPGHNERSGEGEAVKDIAKPVDTSSASGEPLPSPQEALSKPLTGSENPSLGTFDEPKTAATDDTAKAFAPAGAPNSGGLQAVGGPLAPGGTGGQNASGATTGTAPKESAAAAVPAIGPIGATAQTMPAKFSPRNDALDKLPIMAMPPALSDAQKQKVAAAAARGKIAAVTFDASKLATKVPESIELQAMPDDLGGQIPAVKALMLLKTKDKVLLVNPADRVVVGSVDL